MGGKNIQGDRFGRLIALKVVGKSKHGSLIWECICDCGKTKEIVSSNLMQGKTKSCGCYHRERATEANTIHGYSSRFVTKRIYTIWSKMLHRCQPSKANSKTYYDRGITVCEEWKDFETFKDWAYSHGYSDELSIDRINNDEGYRPDNCRWATPTTQARNRRTSRMIEIDGKTKCLKEWCDIYEINYGTVQSRLERGMGGFEALTKPLRIWK